MHSAPSIILWLYRVILPIDDIKVRRSSVTTLGSGVMVAEDSIVQLLVSICRSSLEKSLFTIHSL